MLTWMHGICKLDSWKRETMKQYYFVVHMQVYRVCWRCSLRNLCQHLSYKAENEEPINKKKVAGRFCIAQGKLLRELTNKSKKWTNSFRKGTNIVGDTTCAPCTRVVLLLPVLGLMVLVKGWANVKLDNTGQLSWITDTFRKWHYMWFHLLFL